MSLLLLHDALHRNFLGQTDALGGKVELGREDTQRGAGST